jgi:hypothetical protein
MANEGVAVTGFTVVGGLRLASEPREEFFHSDFMLYARLLEKIELSP